MTPAETIDQQRVQRCIDEIGISAVASYGSLSTAAGVADGLANRLSWAMVKRNEDPDGARAHLVGAFSAWEILKSVMVRLEADAPQYAEQGLEAAQPIIRAMKERDGI